MHSFRGAFCRFCREKRHADGFGAFNFATLVFLLLARHSPQAVSARAACVGCHQKYREIRDIVAGVLYLFSAKSTDRSLRLVFFAAFWSAKSGAKTDPPTKKAERRGLTLAPGDYSRVCKQTVPSARAFSPHLSERLFCQAGVVRRETRREKSAFSLAAEKEQPTARVPGAGGCIVLFLLRPLNAGRRLFPRKRHADGFGATF